MNNVCRKWDPPNRNPLNEIGLLLFVEEHPFCKAPLFSNRKEFKRLWGSFAKINQSTVEQFISSACTISGGKNRKSHLTVLNIERCLLVTKQQILQKNGGEKDVERVCKKLKELLIEAKDKAPQPSYQRVKEEREIRPVWEGRFSPAFAHATL
jgi:hypothetical protein